MNWSELEGTVCAERTAEPERARLIRGMEADTVGNKLVQ